MNATAAVRASTATVERPRFRRDPEARVIELPEGKRLTSPLAAAFGPDGHFWVLQERGDGDDPTLLPHVLEFDTARRLVGGWGGPDSLPRVNGTSQWPEGVEGIEVDAENNVWVFGYKPGDNAVLKFSRKGELLLRIGERGVLGNDASRTHLGRPTTCYHDVAAREVFVSDGYDNHRVIAFHSDTGEFTRMWGAYGEDPANQEPERAFANPVHKVVLGPDGMLYVADRIKNRVQAFERVAGGARFLREVVIAPGTQLWGSAFDLAFSPCGRFMYVSDGSNNRVWIVSMESFAVLGWTGSYCQAEGSTNIPAMYGLIHRFVRDPEGNLILVRPSSGLELLRFEGVW